MEWMEWIKPELLVLVPVVYFIGVGLKKSKVKDRRIPLYLGVIAVLLSFVWVVATSELSTLKEAALAVFTSVTQGVLIAGASVYINQLYVQSKKKD